METVKQNHARLDKLIGIYDNICAVLDQILYKWFLEEPEA